MKIYLRFLLVALLLATLPVVSSAQSNRSKPRVEKKAVKKSTAKKVKAKKKFRKPQVAKDQVKTVDEPTRTLKEQKVVDLTEVNKADEPNERVVFRSVEQMPKYPGEEVGLMRFIRSQINYPPKAAENNIQGTVVLQFIVEADGSVSNAKVVRSVDEDLDREALRIVNSLEKFEPGRQDGQAVAVWYTLPVMFRR